MLPIQITIRDMPNSPTLKNYLHVEVSKLTQFYEYIQSCRIVIDIPQKHKHQGKLFGIRINLAVPHKTLVVSHKLDENIYIAIHTAFQALQRQLETYARKRRGDVKTHGLMQHQQGRVKKIFTGQGYGFIQGMDDNEYYFSLNNVSYPSFAQLQLGDRVQFVKVAQNAGLQAHRVTREKIYE